MIGISVPGTEGPDGTVLPPGYAEFEKSSSPWMSVCCSFPFLSWFIPSLNATFVAHRCKCSNHCLNKVVQHPLRLKLQLFKTARRGWGVRTLHDMPRGGFICVYVGHMLNEAKANEVRLRGGKRDWWWEACSLGRPYLLLFRVMTTKRTVKSSTICIGL